MDKTVIDAPTLKQRIAEGDEPTIIDVRTPAEFSSAHIPGSYNIPLQLLSENTRDLAERLGGDVVLVCRSGARAVQAQQRLAAVGADDVGVLTGGISAFESAGGGVVRGPRHWAMERQVRMAAGSLVLLGFLGSKLINPRLGYLSAAIGGGLTFSALTNSCGMAAVLAKMPWNRTAAAPTLEEAVGGLPTALRKF